MRSAHEREPQRRKSAAPAERVGRDGKPFQIVKFRSMHADAEARLAALKAADEGAGLLLR